MVRFEFLSRRYHPLSRLRNPRRVRALIQSLSFSPVPFKPTRFPTGELPRIVSFRQLEGRKTAALHRQSVFKDKACPTDVAEARLPAQANVYRSIAPSPSWVGRESPPD
jgi:hypothetical protein